MIQVLERRPMNDNLLGIFDEELGAEDIDWDSIFESINNDDSLGSANTNTPTHPESIGERASLAEFMGEAGGVVVKNVNDGSSEPANINSPVSKILVGDCLLKLKELPTSSVDCIVTSPPYWGLRDYDVVGQLGMEPTFDEYVEKLTVIFRECRRVLKDTGTLWINLGDKYLPNKQLLGMPWKVAFALQDDGWILRQDIIWDKPNPMPESVTDRCTKSHEYIFMFAKAKNYSYDNEVIKEPSVSVNDKRMGKGRIDYGVKETSKRQGENGTGQGSFVSVKATRNKRTVWTCEDYYFDADAIKEPISNPSTAGKMTVFVTKDPNSLRRDHGQPYIREATKNKRSVWKVATSAFRGGHFATFPEALIEPITKAGCPKDGVVLDIFMGSGTAAIVAQRLGRRWIGIELNPDYAELANRRIEQAYESKVSQEISGIEDKSDLTAFMTNVAADKQLTTQLPDGVSISQQQEKAANDNVMATPIRLANNSATDTIQLHNNDCFDVFQHIPDQSIDMVCVDLPYGTTTIKWDEVLDFQQMWIELERIIKPQANIIIFGSQPFSSRLITSKVDWFRYELIWNKNKCGSPGLSKYRPNKVHENIMIFSKKPGGIYNPIMETGQPWKRTCRDKEKGYGSGKNDHGYGFGNQIFLGGENTGTRFPKSILHASRNFSAQQTVHPTQKPTNLLNWLIMTYSNVGDTVLDFTMGSGSCGVSAKMTGRRFIGIEKDEAYFQVAQKRIGEAEEGNITPDDKQLTTQMPDGQTVPGISTQQEQVSNDNVDWDSIFKAMNI
jgi:DNA modification methylase